MKQSKAMQYLKAKKLIIPLHCEIIEEVDIIFGEWQTITIEYTERLGKVKLEQEIEYLLEKLNPKGFIYLILDKSRNPVHLEHAILRETETYKIYAIGKG